MLRSRDFSASLCTLLTRTVVPHVYINKTFTCECMWVMYLHSFCTYAVHVCERPFHVAGGGRIKALKGWAGWITSLEASVYQNTAAMAQSRLAASPHTRARWMDSSFCLSSSPSLSPPLPGPDLSPPCFCQAAFISSFCPPPPHCTCVWRLGGPTDGCKSKS